jgi:hypothetical protein
MTCLGEKKKKKNETHVNNRLLILQPNSDLRFGDHHVEIPSLNVSWHRDHHIEIRDGLGPFIRQFRLLCIFLCLAFLFFLLALLSLMMARTRFIVDVGHYWKIGGRVPAF